MLSIRIGYTLTEEESAPRGHIDKIIGWPAKHLHYTGQLFDFILTGEQWITGVKFGENAAEAPHVDWGTVGQTQYDLGTPVEPRLDIGVDALIAVARRAEIDDLD